MEIIDKLTAILNRLESLKQLQDADINYLDEEINRIEYEDLPHLKDENNKFIDYSDNNPDDNVVAKEQIEDLFDKIDEAIYSVRIQFGLNDYKEDDEQIEYVDGGVYDVPEANDFSIVLDEIAKSALNTLGMDNTDSCMVNLMGTILFGVSTGEKDSIVVGKAFAKHVGSGPFIDMDTIKDIYNKTHDKCQLQILGLKIAIDDIRYYNCSAEETLAQIAIFL